MNIIIIILGAALSLFGIIGCIIPGLPGPPLNFIALLLLLIINPESFSIEFLVILGIINIILIILDYVLPILGAKVYGATKYGIWGSIAGLFIGLIFFPPFGMIVGLFIGTIIGEIIGGKKDSGILKAGLASFIISILLIMVKFALSIYMSYYFFSQSFELVFN